VASTPIDLSEVPSLIGLLAEALGDAVATSDSQSGNAPFRPSPWSKIRNFLRPSLAKVVDLTYVGFGRSNRTSDRSGRADSQLVPQQ
jgi:hypothetical protein